MRTEKNKNKREKSMFYWMYKNKKEVHYSCPMCIAEMRSMRPSRERRSQSLYYKASERKMLQKIREYQGEAI